MVEGIEKFQRQFVELPQKTLSTSSEFLEKNSAYIFHHLVKCGGTSLNQILSRWFNMIYDHILDPADLENYLNRRYNISTINSDCCIVGHFAYDGTYLDQRYPEVILNKEKIKAFTFLRNPLNFSVSFYYYSRNQGRMEKSLKEYLNLNKNLIAYFLNCDESNYEKVLEKYFFIGITEKMNESVFHLARIVNKKYYKVPVLNQSDKDSQLKILTKKFAKQFERENQLDYEIYRYGMEKLERFKRN